VEETPDEAELRSLLTELAVYTSEPETARREANFFEKIEKEGELVRLQGYRVYKEAGEKATAAFHRLLRDSAPEFYDSAQGKRDLQGSEDRGVARVESHADKFAASDKEMWIAKRHKDFINAELFVAKTLARLLKEEKSRKDGASGTSAKELAQRYRNVIKESDKMLADALRARGAELVDKTKEHVDLLMQTMGPSDPIAAISTRSTAQEKNEPPAQSEKAGQKLEQARKKAIVGARASVAKTDQAPESDRSTLEYHGAVKLRLIYQIFDDAEAEWARGNQRPAQELERRAKTHLQLLLDRYPGTQAARDAQDLLDGKKPPRRPLPPVPSATAAPSGRK
jgi:hypothetical protein